MIDRNSVRIIVGFALLADAISRGFNLARILFFGSLVVGIMIAAWRADHRVPGTWVCDVIALWILSERLGRWLRILVKGGL